MLSWNPEVTGQVGRMIEVYNPNPSMTFGGMGSKKLIGPNIEYIANNNSHPGAQFSSEFRNLVKSEIARVSAESALETAQARVPVTPALAFAETRTPAAPVTAQARTPTTPAPMMTAQAPVQAPLPVPRPANIPGPTKLAALKQQSSSREPSDEQRRGSSPQPEYATAFLDNLTSTVDSGKSVRATAIDGCRHDGLRDPELSQRAYGRIAADWLRIQITAPLPHHRIDQRWCASFHRGDGGGDCVDR